MTLKRENIITLIVLATIAILITGVVWLKIAKDGKREQKLSEVQETRNTCSRKTNQYCQNWQLTDDDKCVITNLSNNSDCYQNGPDCFKTCKCMNGKPFVVVKTDCSDGNPCTKDRCGQSYNSSSSRVICRYKRLDEGSSCCSGSGKCYQGLCVTGKGMICLDLHVSNKLEE